MTTANISDEIKRIITEELELEFDSAHWMNDNTLTVNLVFNKNIISSISLSKYDLPDSGHSNE